MWGQTWAELVACDSSPDPLASHFHCIPLSPHPSPSHGQIFCTYFGDGNSMARDCDGGFGDGSTCIPGCAPVGQQCLSSTCTCGWDCSYPPDHTADALQAQMDEGDNAGADGVLRHNVRAHNSFAPIAFAALYRLKRRSHAFAAR